MMFFLILAAFVLLLILPVISGLLVSRRNRGGALIINQNKVHDPRYFAKSFAELMKQAEIDLHARKIKLSRLEEFDRISDSGFEKQQYDNLVYCGSKPLTVIPQNMVFQKEVYAVGDICLAGSTVFRSLYTKSNLIIGNGTMIGRWADSEGTAAAYDNCDLGLSLTSASGICVGNNCTFRRLYAPEVLLGCYPGDAFRFEEPHISEDILLLDAKSAEERSIRYILDDWKDENGIVPYTLITDRDLTITEGLVVRGDIRSEKGIHLCEGAVVCGSVFAEEGIVLGKNSRVLGAVFTQGSVTLESGATVGRRGKITSLVARDNILVCGNARIYGYISCEKGGTVNETFTIGTEAKPAFSPEKYTFLYLPGGAVPRSAIALSDGRLRQCTANELYRFPSAVPLPEATPQTVTESAKKPLPKPAGQLAVLAGVCLVCLLAAVALRWIAPPNAVQEETPAAELYRNQGLTQDMKLETVPTAITEDYVVFTDRVLQRFHVSDEELALDAAVYDSVLDLVPKDVNRYLMLVPLRIYYEDDWTAYAGDMRGAVEQFSSRMPEDCTVIDLLDRLPSGQDQYIFYRTEPFWASEGAYYGAAAFFAQKGESLPALSTYNQALYQNFEGSLFAQTGNSMGDDTTYDDRLYFFSQPDFRNQEILYRRQADGSYLPSTEPVLSKSRRAMSAYVGDNTFSHAILKGSVENGKTLLLIGDVSAKIMASYFCDAYETVYVINQIWYSQDESTFSRIFEDYHVTDTLIVESMSALGNEQNRSRIMRIVNDNTLS